MIKVACLSYESFFVVVTQGGVSKFNSVLCSVHQLPSDKLFAFTFAVLACTEPRQHERDLNG